MNAEHTPESRSGFLLRFGALLVVSYLCVASRPVDRAVVTPFTAGIADATAVILRCLGERVVVDETTIHSSGFGISVRNGCNGVEASMLLAAAVFAFPASWRHRVKGLLVGALAIQIVNLVRVVSLFWIGKYDPSMFFYVHVVMWPSFIILATTMYFFHWIQQKA